MRAIRISPALFLLCAALFCACSKKSAFTEKNAPLHFNELRAVEALMETNPVKAMDSIRGLAATLSESSVTPLDDIEMQLRIVQAQYKNRCLTEQSLDLSPIVAFYDSLAEVYPEDADLQYLRANAYYYKGVQWTFANEDVDAFKHYVKALEVMHQCVGWENPYAKRFVALAYTRLSEILYRYGIRDAAIETCHKAASYYESEADLAAMLRFEAAIYQSQKQYDKALALYQEADEKVSVGDDPIQLSIGAKFLEIHQYDSAFPHLEHAFLKGDRFARMDAAAKLAEICRGKGLFDEEVSYNRFYVESSMMENRMASRKMEIEYLYDVFRRPKTSDPTSPEGNGFSSLILSLFLMLVIAFLAYIIVRNRKRISHIENKITTIEQKHEQENADKDHEIEQISQALNDTREQLNAQRVDFDEAWQSFMSAAVVNKIKHSVEGKDIMIKNVGMFPKLKLKEMDYIALVQEANRCFPDFSSRFLKDFPELNVADLRHSCLGLLGMNDAEIAVMEGISYSGANRRTNKILTAVGLGDNLEQAMITYLKKSDVNS
jgi:tetratricopeptide (TPR) repeat protein